MSDVRCEECGSIMQPRWREMTSAEGDWTEDVWYPFCTRCQPPSPDYDPKVSFYDSAAR